MRIWAALLLACLIACSGGGGNGDAGPSSDGLEAGLESIRAQYDLPALAAASWQGGDLLESAAVGLRAVGHPQVVTSADKWHLGSLTKAMTATLAAILVERGVISWRTTIAEVFPGMVAGMRAEYQGVRLDELLYHTSGLPESITTPIWPTLRSSAAPLRDQRRQWTQELLAVAPAVARGTLLYTNAGYIVAGAMLEEVTGVSWETLMQQELFAPLAMTATGFGAPGSPPTPDQPWGHSDQGGGLNAIQPGPLADNPAAIGPAGNVHSTFDDYARFVAMQLAGARGNDGVISSASFGKLHTPAAGSSYGLGWISVERSWAGGTALTHSGSNTLWLAVVWLAPARDIAVFAVTNAAGSGAFRGTDAALALLIDRYEATN